MHEQAKAIDDVFSEFKEDILCRGFKGINVLEAEVVVEANEEFNVIDVQFDITPCLDESQHEFINQVFDLKKFTSILRNYLYKICPHRELAQIVLQVKDDAKGTNEVPSNTMQEWASINQAMKQFFSNNNAELVGAVGTATFFQLVNAVSMFNHLLGDCRAK